MSDDQEFNDDQTGEGEETERFVRMKREDIRRLEKSGQRADELEQSNREMARKLAFLEAGVDLSSPVGQLLLKGYEGDLDAEQIKEQAKQVGALKGESPAEPQEQGTNLDEGERESTDERGQLGGGAQADEFRQGTPDPKEVALKAGRQAIDDGKSEEDALAAYFGTIARAASEGDPRALWDPTAA